MNTQAVLPGVRAEPLTANRAADADLRGEVALAIMAFLTWATFHGDAGALLDGSVDRWLTAGQPADPGIARALTNTRRALSRYIGDGGRVPAWVPPSLAALLTERPTTKGPDPCE